MKYEVRIDPLAQHDMKEIFLYVAFNDSIDAANQLIDKIEETCYKLEKQPIRGHVPEELRGTGIKKYLGIHYKPYRIIYEVKKEIVYIHSVLDGRRNIQEILSERILR